MSTITRTARPMLDDARAEALFVSPLQPSQQPTADQVAAAIRDAVRTYHCGGCAERVAAEFGEHPDTAVNRMRWARDVLARLHAAAERAHAAMVALDHAGDPADDLAWASPQMPADMSTVRAAIDAAA